MQRYNLFPAEFPPGALQQQQPCIPLNTASGHPAVLPLRFPNTMIPQTTEGEESVVQVAADY